MAEWQPGWWARTFGGAGRWRLVIADGRLRVHGASQRITRAGHESPFLLELIQAKALRVRSPAGADITPVICPKCKKRIMRQRQGKRGPFLGCDGYPLCKSTIDVTSGHVPQGLSPSPAPARTR